MRFIIQIVFAFSCAALLCGACAGQGVKVEKVRYFNQPNCYQLTNGTVDVIVTSDVGPRIIAYRPSGGQNMLSEMPDDTVETDFGTWKPMGGHRLWHAPEVVPRTYEPDNEPVEVSEESGGALRVTQKVEPHTHIRKEMLIRLSPTGSEVTITHRLTNEGVWAVELAPWGLTIVRGGGQEIIPNEPFISHDQKKLPARPMVLWNYTDLSDSRLKLGKKFIRVNTDASKNWPNKIGLLNTLGWAAYLLDGDLFVKRHPYIEGAGYPDMGCNYETYTSGTFMEMESLAPMQKLNPGESATHIERWYLFEDVTVPEDDEAAEKVLEPLIQKTREASN